MSTAFFRFIENYHGAELYKNITDAFIKQDFKNEDGIQTLNYDIDTAVFTKGTLFSSDKVNFTNTSVRNNIVNDLNLKVPVQNSMFRQYAKCIQDVIVNFKTSLGTTDVPWLAGRPNFSLEGKVKLTNSIISNEIRYLERMLKMNIDYAIHYQYYEYNAERITATIKSIDNLIKMKNDGKYVFQIKTAEFTEYMDALITKLENNNKTIKQLIEKCNENKTALEKKEEALKVFKTLQQKLDKELIDNNAILQQFKIDNGNFSELDQLERTATTLKNAFTQSKFWKNAAVITTATITATTPGLYYLILPLCIGGCQLAQSIDGADGKTYALPLIIQNGVLHKAVLNNRYVLYNYMMSNYTCDEFNNTIGDEYTIKPFKVNVSGDDGKRYTAVLTDKNGNICNAENSKIYPLIETIK